MAWRTTENTILTDPKLSKRFKFSCRRGEKSRLKKYAYKVLKSKINIFIPCLSVKKSPKFINVLAAEGI